jgi:hypothetical protein
VHLATEVKQLFGEFCRFFLIRLFPAHDRVQFGFLGKHLFAQLRVLVKKLLPGLHGLFAYLPLALSHAHHGTAGPHARSASPGLRLGKLIPGQTNRSYRGNCK